MATAQPKRACIRASPSAPANLSSARRRAINWSSGEILSQVRLQGSFWGTPALVGNKLYCISQEGLAQIVEFAADGRMGEVIGKGEIGEAIQCSPAVADGALYVRSDKHLWKIAQPK